MSKLVKVNYVNKSMNRDMPKIFLFLKNEIPTVDALKEGAAGKVIEHVGRSSSCKNDFPISTTVAASRDDQTDAI